MTYYFSIISRSAVSFIRHGNCTQFYMIYSPVSPAWFLTESACLFFAAGPMKWGGGRGTRLVVILTEKMTAGGLCPPWWMTDSQKHPGTNWILHCLRSSTKKRALPSPSMHKIGSSAEQSQSFGGNEEEEVADLLANWKQQTSCCWLGKEKVVHCRKKRSPGMY